MIDNQKKERITNWTRPTVEEKNIQQKNSQKTPNGNLSKLIATIAAAAAVVAGAGHIAQGMATQTPKVPAMNPTPTAGNTNLPQVDTNALKGNLKGVGRTVVRHADDIGQAYENYIKDDEKDNTATIRELKSKEYD